VECCFAAKLLKWCIPSFALKREGIRNPMHQDTSRPWLTPVLSGALPGSYIYPSSYPSLISSTVNSLESLPQKPTGRLAGAPFLRPSRSFLLYVPASYRESEPMPLVVWLHGCKQSAEDFRDGTRITQWADKRGLIVLMPRQSKWANPFGCWNWFDPATQNGVGETALVVAQTRFVRSRWNIDPARVWVAGMSSGAALAACIAVHDEQEFSAAAFVSGLADGAASSAATASKVMQGLPDVDVATLAHRVAPGLKQKRLPSLIIHGDEDKIAAPTHANELARQMLAVNGESPVLSPLRAPDELKASRATRHERYKIAGQSCVEILRIAGLAHSWSGGDPNFAYNDPAPPDATQIILDFFAATIDERPAPAKT
jgi:poly(hydroxyalkanoate) depolymerase family esterase